MKLLFSIFLSCYSLLAFSLKIGEPLPSAELNGNNGGRLDDTPWTTEELKGKVASIFYVDPDHKDRNEAFSEALKAKGYKSEDYQSVAIVNLKATWLPNFAIRSALRKKQEKFPKAVYLQDKKRHLVKEWGLKDEESDVVIVDREGTLLYFYYGKMDESEIEKALSLIDAAITKGK